MPKIEMPKVEMPKVEAPQFDMSKFDMSKFDMSKMQMPKLEMPKVEAPQIDMSKFDMSKMQMPKVEMPKFEMPKFDPSALKGTITENGKTRDMSQEDLKKASTDMSKMMGSIDFSQLSKNFSTEISDATSKVTGGNATTTRGLIPGYKDPGLQIPGSSLTQNTSVEKLAQEQAADAKKKQAESSLASANIHKTASQRLVSIMERDIAAAEQELATADSDRTKRRLEAQLANQRAELSGAKEQLIEDSKKVLEAEQELVTIQQQSATAETTLRDEAIKQTNSIADQTQSMLAVKKEFLNSELIQIGAELSALDDERAIQTMREGSIQDGIDKLKAEKAVYENNQKYDEKDLAESTEELAMLRNRIDNSQSDEEILELQQQIAEEEKINNRLQRVIAERNQKILESDSDIALKEQELQDLHEEMADTEVAIQDKREQLLDSVAGLAEEEPVLAEQEDTEFGDLDGAMKRASNQMYPDTEFGDLDGAMARNTADNDQQAAAAAWNNAKETKVSSVAGKDPFARMLDKFMGPMAEPGKALAPAEAAKTSATTQSDAAAKAAAAEKAKTDQSGTTSTKDSTSAKTTSSNKEATLSDVVKSLETLNKQVGLLSGEMTKLPNLMEKAVSATKSLNGNLNARVT